MQITLHPVQFEVPPQMRIGGGPRFKNTYIEDANSNPQTQIYWENALWEWKLQFIGQSELIGKVIGFFLARKGGAYAWWFKDPLDHSASSSDGTGLVKTLGDGKRYLVKRYPDTDSYAPYERRIRCPIDGTVEFFGVTGSPSVNIYTGEVTGATSDGTADFEFRNPVIFTTDQQDLDRAPNDVNSSWQVSIREISKFSVAS